VGTHDILDRVAFAFEFSKFFLGPFNFHNFDLLKISLGEDKVTLERVLVMTTNNRAMVEVVLD
jgi:hypothetical protein